jgi:hypothetical protein
LIEDLFKSTPWIPLTFGVISFAVDHFLTRYETHLYHAGAKRYFNIKGRYGGDTGSQDVGLWRGLMDMGLVFSVLILGGGIYAAWEFFMRQSERPEIFMFLIGGLILYESATSLRHLRTVMLFRHALRGEGLQGKIEYSERLSHTLAYIELYGFTAFYLLLFLIFWSWFFLGGALTCFIASRRWRDWVMIRT